MANYLISSTPGSQTGSDIIKRPLPPVDRMTDMCKNITLPQTSFGGGNYVVPCKIMQLFSFALAICD